MSTGVRSSSSGYVLVVGVIRPASLDSPYSPYSPYLALLSSPPSSSTFCADAWLYTFDFRRSERDTGRDGGVCVPAF